MNKPDLCAVMAGTRWSSLLRVEHRTTTDNLVRMTQQAAGGNGGGPRGVGCEMTARCNKRACIAINVY